MPPDDQQALRLTALEKANAIRARRSRLKRDLRGGRLSFAELLANPPEWLLTASVYELLLEVPRVGRVTANTALSHSGVRATATFGSIMRPQREALVNELRQTPARRSV